LRNKASKNVKRLRKFVLTYMINLVNFRLRKLAAPDDLSRIREGDIMGKIRVGIIGTGFTVGIANAHIGGYKNIPECELTALYDLVPGRAKEFAEKNNANIPAYDDFNRFLEAVDAVSICTHNSAHTDMMEKCFAAGKHVICEKPLTATLADADNALALEKKYQGLVGMVVFNYREKPGIAQIKAMLDEGKLGKVFLFRYILGGNRIGNAKGVKLEWRMQKDLSGSGALADFGCHMLELADYLAGSSAGKISHVGCFAETFITQRADVKTGQPGAVTNDDTAVIIAKTEGGCLCSLTTSRLAVPHESIEICGEGGTISHILQTGTLTAHLKEHNGPFTSRPEVIDIDQKYNNNAGHTGVLREFINCILTGEKPVRSLEHGHYIQRVLDALERSIETNSMIEV